MDEDSKRQSRITRKLQYASRLVINSFYFLYNEKILRNIKYLEGTRSEMWLNIRRIVIEEMTVVRVTHLKMAFNLNGQI